MPYLIHLERRDEEGHFLPISLTSWLQVIESTPEVRLKQSAFTTKDPRSGAALKMSSRTGDAEVFDEEQQAWRAQLLWSARGVVSFAPDVDFNDEDAPFRKLILQLAHALGASVVGDSGEVYS